MIAKIFIFFLTLMLPGLLFPAEALGGNKSPELAVRLKEANELADNSQHQQSFQIYKDIASAYRADMSMEEKNVCLEAIYGCIDDAMALSRFQDVARYMVLAEEIRDSENISDGRLEIFYSCMYILMGNESGNTKMLANGYPHAKKAFDYAVRSGDSRKMALSFFHLIGYYLNLQNPSGDETLEELSRTFRKKHPKQFEELEETSRVFFRKHPDHKIREIFSRYYDAVKKEYIAKDYKGAATQYDTILSLLPNDQRNARKRATFLIYAVGSQLQSGQREKAVKSLNEAIALSDSIQQGEYKLCAYRTYRFLYEMEADSLRANLYNKKVEQLEDSLSSFGIADDIYALDRIKEEKELHRQIAIARYHSTVLTWVAILGGIILLTVVVFVFILRCKNAGLAERARILRQLLREHTSPPSSEAPRKPKYEGSTLSEEEKNSIAASIRTVLDSEAVFSPDFSLGTLSDKIGKNSKAVSQVINEIFNTNFSTVVNRIRIYEACRRMDSPEYQNWSVEGIAESVGYTQRNTFSTNFKKFTGMGIREYRKLSEADRNNPNSSDAEN